MGSVNTAGEGAGDDSVLMDVEFWGSSLPSLASAPVSMPWACKRNYFQTIRVCATFTTETSEQRQELNV